jgi:preprotein translocase subunit SecA
MFDVVEDIVTEYKEANNYEGFQLEVIRLFSVDIEMMKMSLRYIIKRPG